MMSRIRGYHAQDKCLDFRGMCAAELRCIALGKRSTPPPDVQMEE
jgi:hypothetical protein